MTRCARIRPLFIIAVIYALIGCSAGVLTGKDSYADLAQHIRNLEQRMEAIESRELHLTAVLAKARGAVAYIWGTYTFVDKEGNPLRHVVDDLGEFVADPQGIPLVDTKASGPIAVSNYCGTAFLAGTGGQMLTNRHIAEPWLEDDESAPLLAAGLKPAFIRLRAFFQERSGGVPIEVLRVDERQDIALAKTIGWVPAAPPLVLQHSSGEVVEGQPIVLMGYPTGLEAIIAKLNEAGQASVEEQPGSRSYATAERLSARKELRPTVTGGFLWEILPNILVYDARTLGGGSGGPLMDLSGKVIGVNFGYLEEFHALNYGIPIQFGERLMAGGGMMVLKARKESQELLTWYEKEQEK